MPAGSVNAKIVDRFGNADDFLDHFIILTRAVGTDIFRHSVSIGMYTILTRSPCILKIG